ncbi:MAG: TonB-dependent receptor [Acidobacteria bacterium]|nr:TonB-dependent receptor [Acidobacteriota bacterium]
MKSKTLSPIAVLTLILLLVAQASPALAQTSRGTVTGVVTDPQGAVIAGATAELTNKGTNQARTTITNDSGLYRFDAVDLGAYSLKITAQGFKAYTATGIEIQANRIATFDIRLETSGTEVVVEVNAASDEILQKSDAVHGGNFAHQMVTQLPTATSNPYNLAALLPGVVRPTGTTGFGNGTDLSINGARPRGNNFLLDGVENNDISIGGPAFQPSNEDQVREVSVQTGLFSAEFGRAGGGVFNQVTNSGNNQYHGTAGWKFHSQRFDALTNSDRLNGLKEPAVFTENNFTATFGGPIIKNKTFFFGAGQWYRFRSTGNTGFLVPTAAGRARLQQLFPAGSNPRVDLYLKAWEGVLGVTSLTNIPLGRAANSTDRGAIEFGQAPVTIPTKFNDNNYAVRLDHTFTEAHRLSGRYLYDHSPVTPNGVNGPGFTFDGDFGSQNLLASHTWVISPTMTNEFRFSFGRINFQFPISPNASELAKTLQNVGFGGTISAFGIQTNIPQFRIANNYLYQETMSKVFGTHTFRFGGEYLHQVARQHPPFNERGSFAFATGGGYSAFANFIDNFSGFRGSANINFGDSIYHPNLDRLSLFYQDTWKVSSTLTLTLGLRYENFGQPANKAFKFPAINLDPATFTTPNKVKTDNNNLGPVVGFAWSPRFTSGFLATLFGEDKTVWRGGYQVSYDTFFNNLLSNIAADSPNTINTTNVDVSSGSAATSRGTANWFPNAIPITPRAVSALDSQTSLFNPNIRNPYTQRYSLQIQRQLPWKMLLDTAYVGSLGRKLFVTEDINPLIGTARRFPTLGIRRMRTNGANSSYNSLQVRLDKAFSHGFLLNTSYTWSRFIDNTSEVFATSNSGSALASVPVFQGGLSLDKAVSDYDRTHRLVFSYIWDLPGPKNGWLGATVGGWQIAGVTTFQSGAPFTILNGVDRNGDGVNGLDRPDIGNPNAPHNTRAQIVPTATCATGLRNPDRGACVTANDVFVVQGVGFPTARTLGRNTERSQWTKNFDTFLYKNFRFNERFRLEYRLEAFNLFNHPQFSGVPGRSVAGTAATQYFNYNLLGGGGRTMRMGLKLLF